MSKSLTIAALLASLTLGGCLGGTTGGGEFVDLSAYQRGKLHFNAGRFGLAVNHFQSAVRREPASIEALNGLAASYDRLGRYDLSARYYQRALATDPESTQTLNNIGYSYLLQERFDLAVAYLRDAQSRDRKDPVVLANRRAAEVSYQEADLKRSAEEARTKRFAAAQPPASPVQVASSRRVKPWIERTAPRVQTLVTQPQLALLGAVEEVGIDPQLAAYRPQQPTAAELLPDHAVAPMTLDAFLGQFFEHALDFRLIDVRGHLPVKVGGLLFRYHNSTHRILEGGAVGYVEETRATLDHLFLVRREYEIGAGIVLVQEGLQPGPVGLLLGHHLLELLAIAFAFSFLGKLHVAIGRQIFAIATHGQRLGRANGGELFCLRFTHMKGVPEDRFLGNNRSPAHRGEQDLHHRLIRSSGNRHRGSLRGCLSRFLCNQSRDREGAIGPPTPIASSRSRL